MAEELPEDLDDLSGARIPEETVEPDSSGGVEADQQAQQPNIIDRGLDAKYRFDQGKQLYGKGKEKLAARSAKKAGKEGLKEGVEKQGAAAAKRKVATRATEEVGKQAVKSAAGKTAVKVGASAVAKIATGSVVPVIGNIVMAILTGLQLLWPAIKKYGKYIIYAVAVLLLLLAVPFGLLGGKGGPQYQSTQAQQDQITALSALSGNSISRTKLIFDSITAEKKRMTQFKNWVNQIYGTNASKASGATARIKEVTSLLDTFEITSAAAEKKKIVIQIKEKLSSFSTDFPELVGFGAVNGYPLDVPGVIEAEGGDCGAASILMVSLYYKQTPGNDVYNAPKKASRANICVSPGYLNGHTPYQDWDYATSSKASFTSVKKSLAAGNPVILYLAAGGIYGPSAKGFGGKHIVVIVGYDPADQTFFINNPSPKKVDIATKTPNGRRMNESRLQQFLGDGVYGHTYIIRKAFL
ncbi:MAG: C39 family peptidase [Candidatus Berkelbacteria bacterium]|nr:C39 family peptidase [Candidatus Berkelbacteria bacterium]MCR4307875.1 C39 family peptidase [Candidatus Berkelbacteria bacterium]